MSKTKSFFRFWEYRRNSNGAQPFFCIYFEPKNFFTWERTKGAGGCRCVFSCIVHIWYQAYRTNV